MFEKLMKSFNAKKFKEPLSGWRIKMKHDVFEIFKFDRTYFVRHSYREWFHQLVVEGIRFNSLEALRAYLECYNE